MDPVVAQWASLNAALILFLPILISAMKKILPTLDGPWAFWLGLGIQLCVGILAWLTTSDPMMLAVGGVAGLATAGTYETAKRVGIAKGSRERGVR